jgi:uncharacterized protein YceK
VVGQLRHLPVLVAVWLSACAPVLTRTGPTSPPRGQTCDFQLLTTVPSRPYVELGVVDLPMDALGANMITNLADFKAKIAPQVCEAGGDVALTTANTYGMYLKATILKFTAEPPAAQGCQYDTQCKGDRVCRAGACTDPVSK